MNFSRNTKFWIDSYVRIKDSLFLTPFVQSDIQPFCNVEEIKNLNQDSITVFIIKDKFGTALNDLIIPKGQGMNMNDPIMHKLFISNMKDSLSIHKSEIDTLEFPRLKLLTGKDYIFPTRDLPAIIKITINLHAEALLYDQITYVNDKLPVVWFINRKKLSSGNLVLRKKH